MPIHRGWGKFAGMPTLVEPANLVDEYLGLVILLIAAGGAVGTAARWWLMVLFPTPVGGIPWVTLGINVAGSFVLGFLARTFMTHTISPGAVAALTVGVCGGFTTFSAYSADTLRLIQSAQWGRAATYALGSVALSLVAVAWGEWTARAVGAG
jgi:CrcB protein